MRREHQTQEAARRPPRQVERRRAEEAAMVSEMIALWCRKHHGGTGCAHRDVRDAAPDCGSRVDAVPRDRIDPVPKLHKLHLCPECERLRAYALARIARCPHMATKTFCSVCPAPCYQAQMREQMRAVMRWAGPRMLLRRPWQALRHAWITLRSKRAASR